jgi:UDP-N-acetylglucosamine 2-epimerase
MATKMNEFLKSVRMDAVVVLGDTNTALAGALVSAINFIPLAHVEAGCRSFDRRMPEEINRVIISDCADVNFAPTKKCLDNLHHESVPGDSILTGHPIVDLFREIGPSIGGNSERAEDYVLLTLHRPENVDLEHRLRLILSAFGKIEIPVVFPVHPRTRRRLKEFGMERDVPGNVEIMEPIRYLETLRLIRGAKFVATDSGGIQQEAFMLNTPCLTIRRSFEWTETFEAGVNFLANPDRPGFQEAMQSMLLTCDDIRLRFSNLDQIFGDGRASERIVQILSDRYSRK